MIGSPISHCLRPLRTRSSVSRRTAKNAIEKACGRIVDTSGQVPNAVTNSIPSRPTAGSACRRQASKNAMPATHASVSFSATSPATPPALYANHMTTSASHSWLIQRGSLANEYGSALCTHPVRTMSRPKVRWPHRSASGAVPARRHTIARSALNDCTAVAPSRHHVRGSGGADAKGFTRMRAEWPMCGEGRFRDGDARRPQPCDHDRGGPDRPDPGVDPRQQRHLDVEEAADRKEQRPAERKPRE